MLAVLGRMTVPQYGYSLIQGWPSVGWTSREGTLYPLLRRLEKQGLLESEWEVGEARPASIIKSTNKDARCSTRCSARLVRDRRRCATF